MILADKIINLRKKAGMSQEELAYQLGVSRQAVSKWEGAQSIPDINKIIDMSVLFGVSTDYLLKDEIEDVEYIEKTDEEIRDVKKVTMEMSLDYLNAMDKVRFKVALGVACCIASPVILILLTGLADSEYLNMTIASIIGLVSLFILIGTGIYLFLTSSFKSEKYNYLRSGAFETEYGVSGLIKEKQKAYVDTYNRALVISILSFILSPSMLIVFGILNNELLTIIGVCVMLAICSCAVFAIIYTSMKVSSYKRLLQEGEYSEAYRERNKIGPIGRAILNSYWMICVAIFLLISFLTNNWQKTWLIWPIAGVLYPILASIIRAVANNKNSKEKEEK